MFTSGADVVRVVSARFATPKERALYTEHIGEQP